MESVNYKKVKDNTPLDVQIKVLEDLLKVERKEVKRLTEQLNLLNSSLQLKEKETLNFEDWKTKYVNVQGEGTYIYDKTSYRIGMIRYFYDEYVKSNL